MIKKRQEGGSASMQRRKGRPDRRRSLVKAAQEGSRRAPPPHAGAHSRPDTDVSGFASKSIRRYPLKLSNILPKLIIGALIIVLLSLILNP